MNYYEILQVSENASDEVIRMAYKALVKKYHPDVFEGDKKIAEEKMKELNEAYEILSNLQKKKEYDSFLHKSKGNKKYKSKRDNSSRHTKPIVNILIIVALLFLAFSQAMHPYIEATNEIIYNNALVFGLRDFALICCLLCCVPFIIAIIKNELSVKGIRIICAINSAAVFLASLILYVFNITHVVAIGWIVTLIFYFINTLSLRIIREKIQTNQVRTRIIVFTIIAALVVMFCGGSAYITTFATGIQSPPVEQGECRVSVRCVTVGTGSETSEDSFAEYTAKHIFEEIKAHKNNETALAETMNSYGSNDSGKLLIVERGTFVEEIDDWCFDPARQRGDIAMIENVYGYTIIYFSGRITD